MGSRLDLEGQFGAGVVPRIGAVGQQRIDLAVEHVIQVRRLEHDDARVVLLGNGHGVVVAVGIGIPADNRAPLLAVGVQRFIAWQLVGVGFRGGFFSRRFLGRGRLFGRRFLGRGRFFSRRFFGCRFFGCRFLDCRRFRRRRLLGRRRRAARRQRQAEDEQQAKDDGKQSELVFHY